MNIIDLVARGLLKEMQDKTLTITRKEIPEFADSVHIACWDGLTEKDREFWRDQAGNLPVSEVTCDRCLGEGVGGFCRLKCEKCDGTGKLPPKTLKQLIEEAQNG